MLLVVTFLRSEVAAEPAGCLFLRGQVEVLEGGGSFQPGCDITGFGEIDRRALASISRLFQVSAAILTSFLPLGE